ncbi:MAG TPA: hypothetical protein VGR21_02140 [Cryptosporangiaceae bacterium]|nr:hypothetical protein [Cryptosporangiaceae bacterium]
MIAGIALAALTACGSGQPTHVPGTAAPVGALTPTASSSVAGRTPGTAPVSREQGGPLWAVALAVSNQSADDPKLLATVDAFAAHGTVRIVSVECDLGIRSGLNLRPERSYWYAALYFESEDAAFAFKTGNQLKVVGVVRVVPTKGCR